jgi:transposase
LRTNTKLTPLQVMLRYRDLLRVEQLFRQAKAVLATRPIYHSRDMAIRGHVFCSFLALLLVKPDLNTDREKDTSLQCLTGA